MVLNRFTTIDSLFQIIRTKKIRLSNPKYWDDKNDSGFIDLYRQKKNLKKVLALCFTDDTETIYHWTAFSNPGNSCCIDIYGEQLLSLIDGKKGFRYGKVNYIRIKDLNKELTKIDDIPFSKRYPYRNESEFRIIYDSEYPISNKYIAIELSLIKKITIDQRLNNDVYKLIKNELVNEYGIQVNRSTIFENKTWINYIEKL